MKDSLTFLVIELINDIGLFELTTLEDILIHDKTGSKYNLDLLGTIISELKAIGYIKSRLIGEVKMVDYSKWLIDDSFSSSELLFYEQVMSMDQVIKSYLREEKLNKLL